MSWNMKGATWKVKLRDFITNNNKLEEKMNGNLEKSELWWKN